MIIGIVGFAGSGKGTVSDILVRDHGFTKLSFADPVKDAVAAIFGWSRELLEGDTDVSRGFREKVDPWWTKKFGYEVTPRKMLQLMGTEAGRDVFDMDLWIHNMDFRLDRHENVVIADVRFPNEIDFIKKRGGFVVRVMRGDEPEWFDTAVAANDPLFLHAAECEEELNKLGIHYSEWAWIGTQFSYLITNNGSLGMLEADIKHLLKVFTGPTIINQVA